MKILLIEPNYKRNKYPPLGLMKISRYHKEVKDDNVKFFKGTIRKFVKDELEAGNKYDRIYISTLFTYQWNKVIESIDAAIRLVESEKDIYLGGVAATLLADDFAKETNVNIIRGLLNKNGKIGYEDDGIIDSLTPDYSILEEVSEDYISVDAYIGYATRGCVNNCSFCAVNTIEPDFNPYTHLKDQILGIKNEFGEKKDLLLLDNNVLASSHFDQIIDDILELGFEKGAKFNGKNRYLDFNQGLDARFMSEHKMKRLSETCLRPVRIAFDDIKFKDNYVSKIRLAAKYGFKHLSNYILFNYKDTPEDFYQRLRINVELNEELGTAIYSFPMKYRPIYTRDNNFIGEHWNKKYLRGVQCILNATRGVVGVKEQFFNKAFGKNEQEFLEILMCPEDYIIYRDFNEKKRNDLIQIVNEMNDNERSTFLNVVSENKFKSKDISYVKYTEKVQKALDHYYIRSIPKK